MYDDFQTAGPSYCAGKGHCMRSQAKISLGGVPTAFRYEPRAALGLKEVNFVRHHSWLLSIGISEESKNDHRQENGGANRSGGRQSTSEAADLGLCHEPCQVVRHDRTLSKSIGAAKRDDARGCVIRARMCQGRFRLKPSPAANRSERRWVAAKCSRRLKDLADL
jgi:hypothetical protein